MSRKEIALPEKFDFNSDFRVRFSDLNGHHMGMDSFASASIDAQLRMFSSMGLELERFGYSTVHSEGAYLAEALLDDRLSIDIAITEIANKSFKTVLRFYNLTREKEAARMVNTHLFFDFESKTVSTAPQLFLESVEQLRAKG